ncbi:MAG: hypothetical protein V7647_1265, partial [Acidobacteriota bacterium]
MSATTTAQEAGAAMPAGPPRADCYRAVSAAPELRDDAKPVMFGHFAEFETWTEVNSVIEGHFMERTASTAFAKTIRENRQNMRVLFHHGRDALGVQVLGKIERLDEDTYYEVELFDGVPPLIMDGLRAGEYGSSYRFSIVQHEFVARPKRSAHNPDGLPELTVVEARVREFGPTPFGQYKGASSAVRSTTDEIFVDGLAQDPERFERLLRQRTGISLSGIEVDRVELPAREYKRSVELVGGAVWAIHPDALATIVGIIGERANGYKPT